MKKINASQKFIHNKQEDQYLKGNRGELGILENDWVWKKINILRSKG